MNAAETQKGLCKNRKIPLNRRHEIHSTRLIGYKDLQMYKEYFRMGRRPGDQNDNETDIPVMLKPHPPKMTVQLGGHN